MKTPAQQQDQSGVQNSKTSNLNNSNVVGSLPTGTGTNRNYIALRHPNTNSLDAARRFALVLECCAPAPAPGPLTSPLIGGLPGSSLLIGQQAASLQLAQIKAQLALTQISNVIANGNRGAASKTSGPTHHLLTTPLTPAAAALHLLNLLKAANTMSNPLYNLYASGAQRSTQGQYGLTGTQAGMDPLGASSHLGSGSGLGSSSSGPSTNPEGMISSIHPWTLSYGQGQSRSTHTADMESTIDMQIRGAREEVRRLSQIMQQKQQQHATDWDPRLTKNPREEMPSLGAGLSSYPLSSSSTSFGHSGGHSDKQSSGGSSMDKLSSYQTPSAASSSNVYSKLSSYQTPSAGSSSNIYSKLSSYQTPSAGSSSNIYSTPSMAQNVPLSHASQSSNVFQNIPLSYSSQSSKSFQTSSYTAAGGGGGGSSSYTSSEQGGAISSMPGLGDCSLSDQPSSSSTNTNQPKYTFESATNILKKFGLENEDLELLTDYPDNELTPENLPFILRDIRLQKSKRVTASSGSDVDHLQQTSRGVSGSDHFGASGGGLRVPEESLPIPRQPSRVIEYGHSSKYTGGFVDEIGGGSSSLGSSGGGNESMSMMDSYSSSSHGRDPPPNDSGTVKYSVAGSSRDQISSVSGSRSSFGSQLSSVTSSNLDPPKRSQRPEQTSQSAQSSIQKWVSPLKKDQEDCGWSSSSGGNESMSMMDSYSCSSHGRDPPPKDFGKVKYSVAGSSRDQISSVSGSSSSYGSVLTSVTPLSLDPPKRSQRPEQTSQSTQNPIQSQVSLLKKDEEGWIIESKSPKPILVKKPGADGQGSTTTEPPRSTLVRGVNPDRPCLVVLGSKEDDGTKAKDQGQGVTGQGQTVGLQGALQMNKPQKPMWPMWPIMFSLNPGQNPLMRPPPLPHMPAPPPPLNLPAATTVAKRLPTPEVMSDYSATTPRIFPHTCSLCNVKCKEMKHWISHQNSSHHIDSCGVLRNKYPDWKAETTGRPSQNPTQPSPVSREVQLSPSSSQSSKHHRQATRGSHSGSRSWSRSPSPRRHHGNAPSGSSRETHRARSPSPRSSRHTHRSFSRSPRRSPPSSSSAASSHRRRPRSRSYERRSSPKSSRRQQKEKERESSAERRSSPEFSRRQQKEKQRESSAERLAKRLLESSAAHSLSDRSSLEDMVQSLAPALLAELAKMKSSSSSSSKGAKRSSSPPFKRRTRTSSPSSSSSSRNRESSKSSLGTKSGSGTSKTTSTSSSKAQSRRHSKTTLTLTGVASYITYEELVAALERFGKPNMVIHLKAVEQVLVCFEKEEDAEALANCENFTIRDKHISIITEKGVLSEEQKNPSDKKPMTSSTSKSTKKIHLTTLKPPSTTSVEKLLLPRPLNVAKKALLPMESLKGTKAMGSTTNSTAKVLVSKAKTAGTKQTPQQDTTVVKVAAKTAAAKGSVSKAKTTGKIVKKPKQSETKSQESKNVEFAEMSKDKPDDFSITPTLVSTINNVPGGETTAVLKELAPIETETVPKEEPKDIEITPETPANKSSDGHPKPDYSRPKTSENQPKLKDMPPNSSDLTPKPNDASSTPPPKDSEATPKTENKPLSLETAVQASAPTASQPDLSKLESTVKGLETILKSLQTLPKTTVDQREAALKDSTTPAKVVVEAASKDATIPLKAVVDVAPKDATIPLKAVVDVAPKDATIPLKAVVDVAPKDATIPLKAVVDVAPKDATIPLKAVVDVAPKDATIPLKAVVDVAPKDATIPLKAVVDVTPKDATIPLKAVVDIAPKDATIPLKAVVEVSPKDTTTPLKAVVEVLPKDATTPLKAVVEVLPKDATTPLKKAVGAASKNATTPPAPKDSQTPPKAVGEATPTAPKDSQTPPKAVVEAAPRDSTTPPKAVVEATPTAPRDSQTPPKAVVEATPTAPRDSTTPPKAVVEATPTAPRDSTTPPKSVVEAAPTVPKDSPTPPKAVVEATTTAPKDSAAPPKAVVEASPTAPKDSATPPKSVVEAAPTVPKDSATPPKAVVEASPTAPKDSATPPKSVVEAAPTAPKDSATPPKSVVEAAPTAPKDSTTPPKAVVEAAPTVPKDSMTPPKAVVEAAPTVPKDSMTPPKAVVETAPTVPKDSMTPPKAVVEAAPTVPKDSMTPPKAVVEAAPTVPKDSMTPPKAVVEAAPTVPKDSMTPPKAVVEDTPTAPKDSTTPPKAAVEATPTAPRDSMTPPKTVVEDTPTAPKDSTTPPKAVVEATPTAPRDSTTPPKAVVEAAPTVPKDSTTPPKAVVEATPTAPKDSTTPPKAVVEAAPTASESVVEADATAVKSVVDATPKDLTKGGTTPGSATDEESADIMKIVGEESTNTTATTGEKQAVVAAPETERQVETTPTSDGVQHMRLRRPRGITGNYLTGNKKISRFFQPIVMIANLPRWTSNYDYTPQSIIQLLEPYGYFHTNHSLYIVPEQCMAFAVMPSWNELISIVRDYHYERPIMNGSRPIFRLLTERLDLTMDQAYVSLMELSNKPLVDQATLNQRLMLFISVDMFCPQSILTIRKAVASLAYVKNHLLLMGKVFIEFESQKDLNAVVHWFKKSLLYRNYIIHICKPKSPDPGPVLPVNRSALIRPVIHSGITPKGTLDVTPGTQAGVAMVTSLATVSTEPNPPAGGSAALKDPTVSMKPTPPAGRSALLKAPVAVSSNWTTSSTYPYYHHAHRLHVPRRLTVKGLEPTKVIARCVHGRPTLWTVAMVTGLPEGGCNVEDITALALPWGYVPGRWNVFVLPFQRRAFVRFPQWYNCYDFVLANTERSATIQGCELTFYVVIETMLAGDHNNEDKWYKDLMKLSNSAFSENKLAKRLIIVDLKTWSLDIFRVLMDIVTTSATVKNYLPLADRVYFEMDSPHSAMELHGLYHANHPMRFNKAVIQLNLGKRLHLLEAIGKVQSMRSVRKKELALKGNAPVKPAQPSRPSPSLELYKMLKSGVKPPKPLTFMTSTPQHPKMAGKDSQDLKQDGSAFHKEDGGAKKGEGNVKDEMATTSVCTISSAPSSDKPLDGTTSRRCRQRQRQRHRQSQENQEKGKEVQSCEPPNSPHLTLIKLEGIPKYLSKKNMFSILERFGPGKKITDMSEPGEVLVWFERKEEAEALAKCKNFTIGRNKISIITYKRGDSSRHSRSSRAPSEEELQTPPPPTSRRANSSGPSSSSQRGRPDESPAAKRRRGEEEARESHTNRGRSRRTQDRRQGAVAAVDFTSDELPADAYPFDLGDFNLEEFITVDEVGDVGNEHSHLPHKSSSSSSDRRSTKTPSILEQSSKRKRAEESSSSSSVAKQSSKESSKDSPKTRSSSSSSSIKELSQDLSKNLSSSSPSSSKDSSLTIPSTTTSSSSSSIVTRSSSAPPTEMPSSTAQKTQQKKSTTASSNSSPAKKSQPVQSTTQRRTTRSSTTVTSTDTMSKTTAIKEVTDDTATSQPMDKVCIEQVNVAAAPISGGVVAKSDHKVSVEAAAVKTAESETEMETSVTQPQVAEKEGVGGINQAQKDSPPQGKDGQSDASPSLEPCATEDNHKTDLKKNTKDDEDQEENYEILDSLDDQEGTATEDGYLVDPDGGSEKQLDESQEGQTPHEETYQILDSADDEEGKSDNPADMEDSFQVLDIIEDLTEMDAEDNRLVKDDEETEKQLPEGDAYQVIDTFDEDTGDKDEEISKEDKFQVLDSGEETPTDDKDNNKMAIEESLQDGNQAAKDDLENQDNKVTKEDALQFTDSAEDTKKIAEEKDRKDAIENQDNQILEEEFHILDSVDDETPMEDDCQKLTSTQVPETPSGQFVEKEDSQIQEEDTYQIVDSVEDQPATEDCEEGQKKKPKKEAKTLKKDDKATKSNITTRASKSVKKQTPERDDKTSKEENNMKTTQTVTGAQKKEVEEDAFEIVDSVEDELINDDLTTVKEAPKKERTPKKDDRVGKRERTTRKSNTPIKDSEEGRRERTQRKEERTTKNYDRPVRRTTRASKKEEEETSSQVVDCVDDRPTTEHPERGKKDNTVKKDDRTSKKEQKPVKKSKTTEEASKTEEDEETMYEVLDSVEDEPVEDNQTTTEGFDRGRKERTTTKEDRTARRYENRSQKSDTPIKDSETGKRERTPRKEDRMGKKYDKMSTRSSTIIEAPTQEEADAYHILDSLEDQPIDDDLTTTKEREKEERTPKTEDKAAMTEDKPPKKSDTPTSDSESGKREKTPQKVERMAQRDDKPTRRSRITAEALEEVEDSYKILDSVEDEPMDDSLTTEEGSERGKKYRTSKKDDTISKKEDKPPKKSDTPTRDSLSGKRERTPQKEDRTAKRDCRTTTEAPEEVEDSYQILDSVEDEPIDDSMTTEEGYERGKKDRTAKTDDKTPKKEDKQTKKSRAMTAVSQKEVDTYQILDSMEDEPIDDSPTTSGGCDRQKKERTPTNEGRIPPSEEEEATYQIVDSVEDEQTEDDLIATEGSDGGKKERTAQKDNKTSKKDEKPIKSSDTTTGASEKENKDSTAKRDDKPSKKEDTPTKESNSPAEESENEEKDNMTKEEDKTPEEEENQTTKSALVTLDEVSEEEEDYPDDTEEEEELRKRQAAVNQKQLVKERERERENKRSKEREEREKERDKERRSSSCSSNSSSRVGGVRRRGKERGRDKEEEKVGLEGMVTLDEVGADEPSGEVDDEGGVERSGRTDGGMMEGDLQALVTVDEIVEEGGAGPSTTEPLPLSQDDESGDAFNPETLVTLDEAGGDDEEEETKEEQANKTSSAAKRKLSTDHTEERMHFVTVDEVGEEDEEEEEVVVTPRRGGRPKKRGRRTPVRKSTRGKRRTTKEEEEEPPTETIPPTEQAPPTEQQAHPTEQQAPPTEQAPPTGQQAPPTLPDTSSSLVRDPSASLIDNQPDLQIKEAAVGEQQPSIDASSTGQDQPQPPENQTPDGGMETEDNAEARAALKDDSKQRREVVESEAKRSRSQSPTVPADFKMPPFRPDEPIGLEFVVPKTGFFCQLCSVFYVNESSAKKLHCGSQRHYQNMEKHYQKLQEQTGSSSQGSASK